MLLGSRQLWIDHRKCKLKEITLDSTVQLRVKDHIWFTNVARCCSISTLKISWFPTCQSSMDWVGGLANWNWGNESRIHPIYHNSISSSTATNDHWLVGRTSSLCTEISRVSAPCWWLYWAVLCIGQDSAPTRKIYDRPLLGRNCFSM